MRRRYTRDEMLEESGARPEELAEMEAKRLLVPNRSGWLIRSGETYYTEQQLSVLKLIVSTRRLLEARGHRRPVPASGPSMT